MPISDDLSPRNFITKIVKYEKVRVEEYATNEKKGNQRNASAILIIATVDKSASSSHSLLTSSSLSLSLPFPRSSTFPTP